MAAIKYLGRLWFGVREPVNRFAYLVSGIVLMLVKFQIEAATLWRFAAKPFRVWDFVTPKLEDRSELIFGAPSWLGWAWPIWMLVFLWIAISMSARRAADAGLSPWFGLGMVVPFLNFALMALLAVLPSGSVRPWVHGGKGNKRRPSGNGDCCGNWRLAGRWIPRRQYLCVP